MPSHIALLHRVVMAEACYGTLFTSVTSAGRYGEIQFCTVKFHALWADKSFQHENALGKTIHSRRFCLSSCAVLTSWSLPVWVLCVCIIKLCLVGALWLMLMLTVFYIRQRAGYIPLISLHGFWGHTCASEICFLFGPALLCYTGKGEGAFGWWEGGGGRDEGVWTTWTSEAKPFCLHRSMKCLILLLCPPQSHIHSSNMWPLRR